MTQQRYAPHGPLALAPRAFGLLFAMPRTPVVEYRDDGVAVVDIVGPLMTRSDPWFDSYEAIQGRVREAAAQAPRAIVLKIDSPGGTVAGMLDTVRALRSIVGGTPLHSYIEGQGTSAAYALACAGSLIGASSSACVGSIGVIDSLIDMAHAEAMSGLHVQLVASGRRKDDGHGAPSTEAFVEAKSRIDGLASLFFGAVAEARRIDPAVVEALQAGILLGDEARASGLVDQVMTFDEFLAAIASGAAVAASPNSEDSMSVPQASPQASKAYEDAIAALRKCAQGDDEDAARAKRMLKAELAEDDAPAKKDEPDGDEPAPAKKDEEAAAASAAVPAAAVQALAAETSKLARGLAALQADKETASRASLFASRPDVDAGLAAALASTPLAQVEKILAAIPKPKAPTPAAAAAASVHGTRGATQGEPATSANDEQRALAVAMGLEVEPVRPKIEGNVQSFPALTRAEAAAWQAERAAKEAAERAERAKKSNEGTR